MFLWYIYKSDVLVCFSFRKCAAIHDCLLVLMFMTALTNYLVRVSLSNSFAEGWALKKIKKKYSYSCSIETQFPRPVRILEFKVNFFPYICCLTIHQVVNNIGKQIPDIQKFAQL